jgi:energy-coupling factor transporter ATP-binding protein EcfA2
MTFFVPEEYFVTARERETKVVVPKEILTKKREWWGFWPAEYLRKHPQFEKVSNELQLTIDTISELAKKSPLVILTIGPPGSGKSTFARVLARSIKLQIVSGDDRKLLGARTADARKALGAGSHVLIDATHPSKTSRIAYHSHIRAVCPNCIFVYVEMSTPRHMAFHMNQVRAFANLTRGVGTYVPEVAYNKYDQAYQMPHAINVVDGKNTTSGADDEVPDEHYFRVEPSLNFARSEDRFRFLQFTEEGNVNRMSTLED